MISDYFEEDEAQSLLKEIARNNGFQEPTFEVSSATKPGDNIMGRVLRAVVRESAKEPLSLIFKMAPPSKARRDGFLSGVLFYNEDNMYRIILQTLYVLLRDHGIVDGAAYPCIPRRLGSRLSLDPSENAIDVLVLEDMAVKGYRMLERSETETGLDAEKCRVVLRQLARLHAASLGLRFLRPGKARQIESKLRDYSLELVNGMVMVYQMIPLVRRGLGMVEARFPADSPELKKLQNLVDNYPEEFLYLIKPDDDISCFNHGDCWSNNILFKFDEDGNFSDICLIDFQLSRVGSPVLDVVYFIFICTTKEIRDVHYQNFLRCYHNEVSSILEALGCDPDSIFSWSDFQDHLKKYGRYGLIMGLVAIPFFLADSSGGPGDVDCMMEDEQAQVSDVFCRVNESKSSDVCGKRIGEVLLDSIELGYL